MVLHSLAKRSQGSGFQSQRRRKAVDDLFTCFADPVHVPVHLLLQLLLLLQEQEARARLHPVLLLRKLAVWETVIRASGSEHREWGKTWKNLSALVKSPLQLQAHKLVVVV